MSLTYSFEIVGAKRVDRDKNTKEIVELSLSISQCKSVLCIDCSSLSLYMRDALCHDYKTLESQNF